VADAVQTLPAGEPALTLGWDVLWWSTAFIRQPDGPTAGENWRFTREQVRFTLWWYALDSAGRWLYTRGVLRRSKGWGKTPFAAALGLAELCGPVRFERFAAGGEERPWRAEPYQPGEPVAMPCHSAWVQLAGVSERQTMHTMSMVLAMCTESPIVEEYGLDLGLTRIYTRAGDRLEPISASAATAEGARPTFVIEDETQHYTESNGGMGLDRVNRRNVSKIPGGTGRVLETTNAHAAGQGSVAEKSWDAYVAVRDGRSRGGRLLYDSREAPPDTDMSDEADLLAGLEAAYGDSTWVDLERIRDEVWDPSTPPEDSRRFYLDQVSSSVDAWVAEPEWAGCAAVTKVVADGEMVVLGFDGSRHRSRGVTDATALVGCRVADGHLFELLVEEQPLGPAGAGWSVPVAKVEAAVHAAFGRYDVVGFYADPAKWESYVSAWEAQYHRRLKVKATRDHPIQWWMTGGRSAAVVRATGQLHSAIVDGDASHDGSYALSRHVLNARRRAGRAGVQIAKEHPDSIRKIDAAVAAILAWQARLDALAAGVLTAKRQYRAAGFGGT
jgi:hypothetical protein